MAEDVVVSVDDQGPASCHDARVTRIDRARAAVAEAGLSGLIAAPGPDLLYLTGYTPTDVTERLTALVVTDETVLVLPGFERAGAEAVNARFVEWSDGEDPYATVASLLTPGRYAVSDACWALHAFALQEAAREVSFTSMTAALPLLRAVKDADELARMEAAGAAADATFRDVLELPFAGRRERDVAADLARLLVEHGHSSADFTIVGSGPNGANPHHGAGGRAIEHGDAVVLDFGGTFDGYCSDTTRTVHVGDPSEEHLRVHEIVRAAQQAGVDAIRPGAACQDVDRAARAVIEGAGFGDRFTHRTGHGIGIDVHEPPYIVEGETQPLEPGMCFSVEPGIYVPGAFGVRIEDIVTVTERGARRLNNSPREPQIVT
jgi:D-alanyl-D-alanine dipeptidase